MGVWEGLSPAWRACWEEGWAGYLQGGNYPIGAAVVDAEGRVRSRGRNHVMGREATQALSDHELAHAEVNALIALGHVHPPSTYALYTLLEPCPLCMGAFYMSGVRELHFAARDPYAGSAGLLGATPYMARKPVRLHAPAHAALEQVYVAVLVAAMQEVRGPDLGGLAAWWSGVYPDEVDAGRRLFEAQVLVAARGAKLAAEPAFAAIESALAAPPAGASPIRSRSAP